MVPTDGLCGVCARKFGFFCEGFLSAPLQPGDDASRFLQLLVLEVSQRKSVCGARHQVPSQRAG